MIEINLKCWLWKPFAILIIKFCNFANGNKKILNEFQQNIIELRNGLEKINLLKHDFQQNVPKVFSRKKKRQYQTVVGFLINSLSLAVLLSQKKTTFPLFSQYAQTLLRSEVIRFLSRTQNHILYCPIQAIANRIPQKQGPIAGIPIGNTGPGNLTLSLPVVFVVFANLGR